MRIVIASLDLTHPQPAPGTQALAYWCRFRSELGSGEALFVPGSAHENAAGHSCEVRPDLEVARDLLALPAGTSPAFALAPLEARGVFQATGKVNSIVWLDDEMENGILEILVGEALFSIPLDEPAGADFAYGEWVTFRLEGLIFWKRTF